MRWATPSPAGPEPRPSCRQWEADPTSTPFRIPGVSMARWACSALWKLYARCNAPAFAPPLHRTAPLHFGRAHALRHRLSRQPSAVRHTRSRTRHRSAATAMAQASIRSAPPPASPVRWHRWRCPPRYYHAFVELHIEQGPLLERAGIPLGIVTAIAAPATSNSNSKAKAATPAPCSCPIAATLFWPPPRSRSP